MPAIQNKSQMKTMTCCICDEQFKTQYYGNNPAPMVNDPDAVCCDQCNKLVIKARCILAENEDSDDDADIIQTFFDMYRHTKPSLRTTPPTPSELRT